jgi:hypothetical protein
MSVHPGPLLVDSGDVHTLDSSASSARTEVAAPRRTHSELTMSTRRMSVHAPQTAALDAPGRTHRPHKVTKDNSHMCMQGTQSRVRNTCRRAGHVHSEETDRHVRQRLVVVAVSSPLASRLLPSARFRCMATATQFSISSRLETAWKRDDDFQHPSPPTAVCACRLRGAPLLRGVAALRDAQKYRSLHISIQHIVVYR